MFHTPLTEMALLRRKASICVPVLVLQAAQTFLMSRAAVMQPISPLPANCASSSCHADSYRQQYFFFLPRPRCEASLTGAKNKVMKNPHCPTTIRWGAAIKNYRHVLCLFPREGFLLFAFFFSLQVPCPIVSFRTQKVEYCCPSGKTSGAEKRGDALGILHCNKSTQPPVAESLAGNKCEVRIAHTS